ncbi:MAG: DUF4124 domain-containing protein [Thermodesulfobacteriota bacterium]
MKRIETLAVMGLFVIVFIYQPVQAEIYRWIDEKGTIHFTEDPATIPEKYKEKAGSRTTEEDLMTPEERAKARAKEEQEVKERLLREKKDYDAKELERRVKELVDKAQKQRGECKIVSYSQYDVNLGGGYVTGNVDHSGNVSGIITGEQKNTCVDLVIQNNDRESKTITEQNIIATTSRPVAITWKIERSPGMARSVPDKTKTKFNPKAVFIQLNPGQTYRGSICFDKQLPIAKLELEGL